MMTKIEKQSGWLDKINDYIAANEISNTAWSSQGIVYKNGCVANTYTANQIQYRIIKFGNGLTMLNIVGWVTAPAMKFDENIVAFTIPTNISNQVSGFGLLMGSERNSWGDLLAGYDFNSDTGEFKIHNKNSRDDGSADASNYMVDYAIIK